MNLTAQQIITDAFQYCGIWDGISLTTQEYTDGLRELNKMIDRWNLTELLVYTENIYAFPFVSGVQVYSLGLGSSFLGSISGVTLTVTSTPTSPLAIGQQITLIPGTFTQIITITGGSGTTWTLSQDCGVVASQILGNCVESTIGGASTMNLSIPRPARIDRASIQYGSPGAMIELALTPLDIEGWQSVILKQSPSLFPLWMYNDTGFPNMNLYMWPVPSGPANLVLYNWDSIGNVASLATLVELPQGYTDALVMNLALRICQIYDRIPSQWLVTEAKQARFDIDDINAKTPQLHYDPIFNTGRVSNPEAWGSAGRVVF